MGGLAPKQSRAMALVATTVLPTAPDAVSVSLGKLRETEPRDLDAAKIAVGAPTQREGTDTYVVEVTNGAAESRVIGLFSAYMKGDEMVAYGEATVSALKPGESRSVTVRPVTSVPAYDRVVVNVRNVV